MQEGSGGGGRRPGHRSEPSLHLLVHARHGGGSQQQGQPARGLGAVRGADAAPAAAAAGDGICVTVAVARGAE